MNLEVTVLGLRQLGHWPPAGNEQRPGPWDTRVWGLRDLPLLKDLQQRKPEQLHGPLGDPDAEKYQQWAAFRRLVAGGLVRADVQDGSATDIALSFAGESTLGIHGYDRLNDARAELARGAKTQAVNIAAEEVLGEGLKALARSKGIALTKASGKPVELAMLSENLKAAGALDEIRRTQVQSVLAVRNATHHGREQTVSDGDVELAIDLVDRLRPFLGE